MPRTEAVPNRGRQGQLALTRSENAETATFSLDRAPGIRYQVRQPGPLLAVPMRAAATVHRHYLQGLADTKVRWNHRIAG
jgi:hypothetical protein